MLVLVLVLALVLALALVQITPTAMDPSMRQRRENRGTDAQESHCILITRFLFPESRERFPGDESPPVRGSLAVVCCLYKYN